ncbi:MAG: PASTA domain-containing protein [bacterium]
MMVGFIKRFTVIVVLAAAAFLLGYVVVDRIVMPHLVGLGRELDVPDVTGKTLEEAKAVLQGVGLRYNVSEQRYDHVVPLGFVISQQPMPNHRIKERGLVSLITSLGQEKVSVPHLFDLNIVQAKSLLERLGLTVGRIDTVYSDSIRGGRVVSTNPPSDSLVYRGTQVNITLSGAKPLYFTMPDLYGLNFESVRDSIVSLGLEIANVKVVQSTDSEKGIILLQSPQPGMTVKRGDKVVLAISSGRQ